MSKAPTFEERVRRVITVARSRREQYEARRHSGGIHRTEEEPTSCSLTSVLAELSDTEIKKLVALMYAGRDGEDVFSCHRNVSRDSVTTLASIALEKLPLDQYLERGLERAMVDAIALESDFEEQRVSRASMPSDPQVRQWYKDVWAQMQDCWGCARDLVKRSNEFAWVSFDAPELRERVRPATAIELARKSVNDPLVVITGPTGVGKSSLAETMCRDLPFTARISPSRVGVYGWGRGDEPDTYSYVARTSSTLIVDINMHGVFHDGIELYPPHVVLGNTILDRVARRQHTIITTANRSEFARKFGDRVAEVAFSGTIIELDPNYSYCGDGDLVF